MNIINSLLLNTNCLNSKQILSPFSLWRFCEYMSWNNSRDLPRTSTEKTGDDETEKRIPLDYANFM